MGLTKFSTQQGGGRLNSPSTEEGVDQILKPPYGGKPNSQPTKLLIHIDKVIIHKLTTAYPQSTYWLFTKFLMYIHKVIIHKLPIAYPQSTYCISAMFLLHIHKVLNTYPLSSCCICTCYPQIINCISTKYLLHIHNVPTAYPQSS